MGSSPAERLVKYLWKTLILILTFQGEGQSYANWFSYIVVLWRKCLALQFLSSSIRNYFTILTGVETWCFTSLKIGFIFLKIVDFESSSPKWRSVQMPISCFIFLLSNKMPLFSVLTYWHTYVFSQPKKS